MEQVVISVLASGRGSNFLAVADAVSKGSINARFGALVSDRAEAKALEHAAQMGIASFHVSPKDYSDRESHERRIIEIFEQCDTGLVLAAGYMRLLTPLIVQHYRHRIINIHPALLPAFPGIHAQRQALEYGVKISGCTVHFVDEGTDTGPVILQRPVPVLDNDTEDSLSARILEQEHLALPEAVRLFCEHKLRVDNRRVCID